ncbi:MAG: hypothetical protein M5U28_33335 [Sandaracinaceae bacterium]|nr:hypothetical protein [Sandaracinaceae bacterium]
MAAAFACEHPAEPDDTAEARGAVDVPRDAPPKRVRRVAKPPHEESELAAMPMPGPRTSTPGGVAARLHAGEVAGEEAGAAQAAASRPAAAGS